MSPDVSTSRSEEILTAAANLFIEKGYAGASMTALSRIVGIKKASLYHHFESKEALFVACAMRGHDVWAARLRSIREDSCLSDEDKVRAAFDVAYEAIVVSPIGRMSPTIAETSRAIPTIGRRFWDEFITGMREPFVGIIADGVSRGAFRPMDERALNMMVFGPAVHLSLGRQMFGPFEDVMDLYEVEPSKQVHLVHVLRLLRP